MTTPIDPSLGTRDPGLLIAGMQRTALEQLGLVLESTLRRADDYLFDRSTVGTDGAELTALRDLRRARSQIVARFEQSLIRGFRNLSDDWRPDQAAAELSLLSEEGLEQQLADEQMVDSLMRQHASTLEVLEKRLATLLSRPAMASGENPVAPPSLAGAMRTAMHDAELSTGIHIVLVKFFERELSPALSLLYDRMNATLAAAGILPRLTPVKPAEPPPQQVAQQAANDPTSQPEGNPESAMGGAGDQALFSSLIGLLQSWRQKMSFGAQGQPNTQGQPGKAAENLRAEDLQSVLSLMQGDPPPSLDRALDDSRLSLAEQLRREVLAGARRLGIAGNDVNLSSGDEDAVDLVGMLFDVLLDERDFDPGVRHKIGRMLVPYVKVAVKDRRLFLYKGHPARRLLNAVAEACEGNHGDGPQERELLNRVDATIDRLVAEFNEDIAIFETLEQELRAFMGQHRKRIELAERRAAEAQRGRERLEQARGDVEEDLARHRGDRSLPRALDEFVMNYARHHLTQVVLREGRDAPGYGEGLRAVAGLMAAFDLADLGVAPERQPPLDGPMLQAIMASSGCVDHAADEALKTIRRTLEQLAAGDDSAANEARLPDAPTPAEASTPLEPILAAVPGLEALDYDHAVAERMRTLDIGRWVQLTSESGRAEPAKVSWISPISSRFLFVNRRGIRVLVASAEELAAMAKVGRLQLRETDNAFDDAMHGMMGRLKTSVPAA
ncbi:MAG TPA: DUF1631 family protein [Lysobacter sp.]